MEYYKGWFMPEMLKRPKSQKKNSPAKFSGVNSSDIDLSPAYNIMKNNNMHFHQVPPYLQNLTTVEMALISRITVAMNVHLLRYGMLACKGHTISLPQENKIANALPLLPEEIGIIVLRKKGRNEVIRQYTAQRNVVEDAIKGLCFGFPNGGLETYSDGYKQYDGPDHISKPLNGRYFQHFPNRFYKDVAIEQNRLDELPEVRSELPGLQVIPVPNVMLEEDQGPAPAQVELAGVNDESTTTSGIACPLDPRDSDKELKAILDKLLGKTGAGSDAIQEGKVASVDWNNSKGQPLTELKTPGYFTMAFPTVFVNGSCDITVPKLVDIDYDEWTEHIYFNGDARVSKHPYLKFLLFNLSMRNKALSQGSFVVAQQLNDAHLSIAELAENLENDDDSVPRKIISIAANLKNTQPFWKERKRELDELAYFRYQEYGDMPAYFDTMSCAEYHCVPLLRLLVKFHSVITGINEEGVQLQVDTDASFKRKLVLDYLHIVTNYFNARTINYYASVMKELLQYDDIWWRYEFAKSRCAIHCHGIAFSKKHSQKVKEALENENSIDELKKWLQTADRDEPSEGIFSPGFSSMHPAGGQAVSMTGDDLTWVPNKDMWCAPEGTQPPPETNPLTKSLLDKLQENSGLNDHYIALVNRIALHICNGYCLKYKRKNKKDSDSQSKPKKSCRFHYGELNPETKRTSGKPVHPFEAQIIEGSHPRYEGPRDHPRYIMHIKLKLLTWLANCDTQPIIDQDLLALLKYISGYACKGGCTTEDLIHVFKHLLEVSNENTGMKSVAQKLIMKIIGFVDVSAAAVDYMNTGGKLYHCTRRWKRIGLSGYRTLDKSGVDGNITKSGVLDKFLSEKRRLVDPEISLWDWAKQCDCPAHFKCGSDHVPLFTGTFTKPTWPVTEEFAKARLMIHSKGTWYKPEDLKDNHDTYVDAFAEFLDSQYCPISLRVLLQEARNKFEKKRECINRTNGNNDRQANQYSQTSSTQTTDSQDSQGDADLTAALLRDVAQFNMEKIDDPVNIPPLNDGGSNFNWHDYGLQCLGVPVPTNAKDWLKIISEEAAKQELDKATKCNLPEINLRLANPLQRVIIAINIIRLLAIKRGTVPQDVEPLRLIIQGTAGVGKTFVITALTYVVRRLFGQNCSVMNLAPTGAASVLLPDGKTVHSTTPIPKKKKDLKNAQLSDYPMTGKSLKFLRTLTGTHSHSEPLKLMCLNLDERSMFSGRLLAWCSQRFKEATTKHDETFGGIPIVNFFGDLGQLGPVDAKDLHVLPNTSEAPDKLAGYAVYRSFKECIVLTETMRQGPDQINLLNRLLRVRNGSITQQDWVDINARYVNDLPIKERANFDHNQVMTLMETWQEVNLENYNKLITLNVPVAVIHSIGSGKHHSKIDKQCGQIMHRSLIAVGATVLLTKNQQGLTSLGLNNGAIGKVIAILYAKNTGPPHHPIAVVVEFPGYKGPAWITEHPKWVPIVPNDGRCEENCCVRTGLPLMPGYAITIAKSQGMTIGQGKPATHAKIKLQSKKVMEQLSLGITYTALSRVEKEDNWALMEHIPADRLLYINEHPHMVGRRVEEERLSKLSDITLSKYERYATDVDAYIRLLQELDEICNDFITDSVCSNSATENCLCILCKNKNDGLCMHEHNYFKRR